MPDAQCWKNFCIMHTIWPTLNIFYHIIFQKKLDKVLKNYDAICQINSERYLQLERAQSLVNQFWETYEELWPWLTETQRIISQLPAPALEYETLRQQQEEHRVGWIWKRICSPLKENYDLYGFSGGCWILPWLGHSSDITFWCAWFTYLIAV